MSGPGNGAMWWHKENSRRIPQRPVPESRTHTFLGQGRANGALPIVTPDIPFAKRRLGTRVQSEILMAGDRACSGGRVRKGLRVHSYSGYLQQRLRHKWVCALELVPMLFLEVLLER